MIISNSAELLLISIPNIENDNTIEIPAGKSYVWNETINNFFRVVLNNGSSFTYMNTTIDCSCNKLVHFFNMDFITDDDIKTKCSKCRIETYNNCTSESNHCFNCNRWS